MRLIKKISILCLVFFMALAGLGLKTVTAQEVVERVAENSDSEIINLSGSGALLGEPVTFTISDINNEDQVLWDFGDGATTTGQEVAHTYTATGIYPLTAKIIYEEGALREIRSEVNVFAEYIIAIVDRSVASEEIKTLAITSAEQGLYLKTLEIGELQTLYQRERSLTELLIENAPALSQAKLLIDWTQGVVGLSALLAAQQAPNAVPLDLKQKTIISVSSASALERRLAQLSFDIVQPQALVLVEKKALPAIVSGQDFGEVTQNLQKTGTKFEIIIKSSPPLKERVSFINFFFPGVEYLAKRGLPLNTLVIFLALPLIALFFIVGKQIIGLRTFGLYIPVLLTTAILPLGLITSLIVFVGSIFITELIRPSFKWARLSFLPRSAILITAVTLLFLGLFVVAGALDYTHLLPYAIFPALLSIPLIEKFASVRIEKSRATAMRYTLETLIMVVISFVVINLPLINTLIISFPETIIIIALLAFLVGRFTGLRLVEYYRFQDLIRILQQKQK